MRNWRQFTLGLVSAVLFLASGCQSYTQRLELARRHYYDGQLDSALEVIDKAESRLDSASELLKLEKSVVLLADGRAREAEQLLRTVRDRLDVLEDHSLIGDGLSLLTDDTHQTYAGEDYEKVLIRVFLALSNLMHDGGDAEAYSLQILDKQQQIVEAAIDESGANPKSSYKQVALGAYLRGILRESTHVNYDDAIRSYEVVASWQPEFWPIKDDLQRVRFGHHSQKGNGVVHIFTLVGRGPLKTEVAEVPTSQAMLIADRIFSALGKQTVPPTLAPIKVPKVIARNNRVRAIGVNVDGRAIAATQTITPVTHMAISQAEALHDQTVGRAVARRTLKKGVVYGAKEVVGIEKGSLAGLGVDLLGVAYEAVEHADTRSWSFLPDTIQVLRLELPVGQHQIGLVPVDQAGRACGPVTEKLVSVVDGANTYVLANFPTERLVGRILAAP